MIIIRKRLVRSTTLGRVVGILVTDYTFADDVGVIGGVSSLVGDSLASGKRCS